MPTYWTSSQSVEETDDEFRSRRRRWGAGMLLAALIVSVLAYFSSSDAGDLAKVEEMRQELFSEAARKLPEEERRAKFEAFRNEVDKLDQEQKSAMFEAGMAQAKQKLDDYFKLKPAEKVKYLDAEIARMEAGRKEWEARRAERGDRPEGDGPRGPGAGGEGGGRAGGPPGSGRGNRTPQEMESRKKEFLDKTTPKMRATMDAFRGQMEKYREDMNARRQQLGLQPLEGRGPGGGFGGPRFGGAGFGGGPLG